jgi:hypothetical protein
MQGEQADSPATSSVADTVSHLDVQRRARRQKRNVERRLMREPVAAALGGARCIETRRAQCHLPENDGYSGIRTDLSAERWGEPRSAEGESSEGDQGSQGRQQPTRVCPPFTMLIDPQSEVTPW